MTKSPRVPKPPRTYTCRFCQFVFKRSEHLARHERSHTQEKPFGCSVCSCMFSRKDLVVRHERMIHFERKPTTRMTSRKARKYEPRRESQSSDVQESKSVSPSEMTTPSSERRRSSVSTAPTIDAAAAKKTAEEALSSEILRGLPTFLDDDEEDEDVKTPITPISTIKSTKRKAEDENENDPLDASRPTKLQILDQTLTSPTSVAPVAPMFGRPTSSSHIPTAASTTLAPAPKPIVTVPTSIFPGFDIDPILRDPEFERQMEDDDEDEVVAEDTLRMFTHTEQQLFSPPLSESEGEKGKTNEEVLRETAAEAWRLQAEEEVKIAA